ncbi:hypothetical protein Tco_1211870 [Tanacetum coccineum]
MSTPVNTSSTDSQMHNNIMAAGSKDRPPMLGPGRYSQWRSRFLRYIDTKNNGEGLKKCILNGPYVPTSVLIQQHTAIETVLNMTPENKEHFQSEKEAIFLLLTGIGDEIYSTVDACNTANEMWIAIERLQQGESLNVQDVKTNLFWEFGKFTSSMMDGSWSLITHASTRMVKNGDTYYQAPKPQRSNATSSSTRQSASTRHKGKEVAKPITPQSESVSEEDSDPEQAQRDKECNKEFSALLAKTRMKDTTPSYTNDNQSGHFGDQRTMTVAGVGKQEAVSYMAKIQEVSPEESSSTGEENKTILKQLKKANASLTQELEKCKTNLDETNSALGEAISCRDSCLIALQNKQNEFEKYKAFNDRTIDYEILQTKLNETLGLLALKDIEIKEGLKTKAYEISVLNQKHDELVKKSLLTKSQLEGYLKENTKVISDLKVKEDKDIDKMIEMDKQLKFLNEIVYTRNQSIQTIHMLAPKCATYNGRLTFANPRYLKKAQSEKPCLYEIPFDTSDPANKFAPERE